MIQASLFYKHVASNWGDLAINVGVQELFSEAAPAGSVLRMIPLTEDERFASRANELLDQPTHLVPLPVKPKVRSGREELDQLRHYYRSPELFVPATKSSESEVFLLNSGEHLFESDSAQNILDLAWRILPAVAAIHTNKTAVLLPSTLGPFHTKLGHSIKSFIVDSLDAFAFRDSASLSHLGKESTSGHLLLDPAFFVPKLDTTSEYKSQQRSVVTVVPRLENYGLRAGSRKSSFTQARINSESFTASHMYRVFLACSERFLTMGNEVRILIQTDADRNMAQALHSELTSTWGSERVTLADPETFAEYQIEIASSKFLLSARFHACIFALSLGTPTIGLYAESHGHKMKGLFGLAGVNDSSIRVDRRTPEAIAEQIEMRAPQLSQNQAEFTSVRLPILRFRTRKWLEQALHCEPLEKEKEALRLQTEFLAYLVQHAMDEYENTRVQRLESAIRKLSTPK